MSRGIGKTQKLILETLDQYGPIYLAALAGGDANARYKSLHRASTRLWEESRLEIHHAFTNPRIIIAPDGLKALGPTCGVEARLILWDIYWNSLIVMKSLGFELPLHRKWAGHWLNEDGLRDILEQVEDNP